MILVCDQSSKKSVLVVWPLSYVINLTPFVLKTNLGLADKLDACKVFDSRLPQRAEQWVDDLGVQISFIAHCDLNPHLSHAFL